jgi:glycosyltransferase involved in cell wall biosynthesis
MTEAVTLSDCFVSVVAPLHDDADIVEPFVIDVTGVLESRYANWELVLVDDGSSDETVDRVMRLLTKIECVRLIRLSRSFGPEVAITAGLDSVIGDFVVVMMPDTDPPALIPRLVARARSEAIGIFSGIRPERPRDSTVFRLAARLFYWYANRFARLDMPRNTSDFRVYSRQSVNAITRIKDHGRYLRTFSTYVGYNNATFLYEPIQRRAKPRARGLVESVALGIDMIVVGTSHPLRMATWAGLSLSLLSAAHAGYVLVAYWLSGEASTTAWSSLSMHISAMFCFVFAILAALSEYIGRLLGESTGRPLYYVAGEHTSSVLIADAERKNVVTDSMGEFGPEAEAEADAAPWLEIGLPISVIVPCYNEEKIIARSVATLLRALPAFTSEFEILLSNDGSLDGTFDVIRGLAERHPQVRALGYDVNRGAGHAFRHALAHARGEYVVHMDADLAMDPLEVCRRCLDELSSCDIVIASRYLDERADYPLRRRLPSRIYGVIFRTLFGITIRDAMSGFFGFRREILERLPPLESDGFEVYVELFVAASRRGMRVIEIPMKFRHQTESGEVSLLRHAPRQLMNTLRIWRKMRRQRIAAPVAH